MDTTTTRPYAPKISSGIAVVDEAWGGLYQGGSYLVYGQADGGRSLAALFFSRAGVNANEKCLYVTSNAIEELARRARRVGIDLQPAIDAGCLEVLQLPASIETTPSQRSGVDDLLTGTLSDLVEEVEIKRPRRVVIDTFMPFVRFGSFARFRSLFIAMLERIDATDATLMLTMAEPANDDSRKVIAFMRSQTTGTLHVEAIEPAEKLATRKITLLPGIGHGGQTAVRFWEVEEQQTELLSTETGSSRRFRFADAELVGDDAPSLIDARWDAAEEPVETEPKGPGQYPAGAVNGSSHTAEKDAAAFESVPAPAVHGVDDAHAWQSSSAPSRSAPDTGERLEFTTPEDVSIANDVIGRDAAHERESEIAVQTDRERFRAILQDRYLRSSINEAPFLLIAMRMDRREDVTTRPFDFEFIHDLVSELLRDQDDVYVDLDRERLIVMLGDTDAEGSRPFFTELRRRLREEAPHQAEYLLQSVSAIVVPNGRPFQNAEEFLSYALNEG